MEADANIKLVGPGTLQDLWAWMDRAGKIAQNDGARIGKFDFSYQGVLPVVLGSGGERSVWEDTLLLQPMLHRCIITIAYLLASIQRFLYSFTETDAFWYSPCDVTTSTSLL